MDNTTLKHFIVLSETLHFGQASARSTSARPHCRATYDNSRSNSTCHCSTATTAPFSSLSRGSSSSDTPAIRRSSGIVRERVGNWFQTLGVIPKIYAQLA